MAPNITVENVRKSFESVVARFPSRDLLPPGSDTIPMEGGGRFKAKDLFGTLIIDLWPGGGSEGYSEYQLGARGLQGLGDNARSLDPGEAIAYLAKLSRSIDAFMAPINARKGELDKLPVPLLPLNATYEALHSYVQDVMAKYAPGKEVARAPASETYGYVISYAAKSGTIKIFDEIFGRSDHLSVNTFEVKKDNSITYSSCLPTIHGEQARQFLGGFLKQFHNELMKREEPIPS